VGQSLCDDNHGVDVGSQALSGYGFALLCVLLVLAVGAAARGPRRRLRDQEGAEQARKPTMSREVAALVALLGAFLLAIGVLVARPRWLGFDTCKPEPFFDCGPEPGSTPVGLLFALGGFACLAAAVRAARSRDRPQR
jgi:hypothetical protein